MILFCGIPSESPMQAAIEAADSLGVDHAVFNQRESQLSDISIRVEAGKLDGILRIRERDIPLGSIRGVFLRLMDYWDLPENKPRGKWSPVSTGTVRSGVLHASVIDWLEVSGCRVLNRPSSIASNMSKPYQARRIRQVGFGVPETMITNDPETVCVFKRRHRRVIYKSTSSVRSVVQELDDDRAHELEQVRDLPTQFQEYIPGTNVRVHTVGRRLVATEVQSEAVDYRYVSGQGGGVTLKPCKLPPSVADRCIELSRALDLPFSGIDLKRTPDNEYYCLEVNPSPAYTYYQEHTGQPIAVAVVDYLVNGASA